MAKKWKPPKITYIHCDYCEQQKPIPSQDREMDAILDEDGYFNVLDNTEEGNMPATAMPTIPTCSAHTHTYTT